LIWLLLLLPVQGAISVCYHYASPASRGLFQAAIMQSGTCDFSGFFQTLDVATNFSQLYATGLGCRAVGGGGAAAQQLACMRNKTAVDVLLNPPDGPEARARRARALRDVVQAAVGSQHLAQELLGGSSGGGAGSRNQPRPTVAADDRAAAAVRHLRGALAAWPLLDPSFPYGPVIDGTTLGLRKLPLDAIEAGEFDPAVPLIIGTNLNEVSEPVDQAQPSPAQPSVLLLVTPTYLSPACRPTAPGGCPRPAPLVLAC
jgi:carboxylesterase type B